MNKSVLKNALMAIFLIVALAALVRLYFVMQEKALLAKDLAVTMGQVVSLEKQKQNLLQDLGIAKEAEKKLSDANIRLKGNLKASNERVNKLFADYGELKKSAEALSSQLALLKEERSSLVEQRDKLTKENEELKTKFSSVAELKKAIAELRKQAHWVVDEVKRRVSNDSEISGNRGYILKAGKSTFPGKVIIDVVPAK